MNAEKVKTGTNDHKRKWLSRGHHGGGVSDQTNSLLYLTWTHYRKRRGFIFIHNANQSVDSKQTHVIPQIFACAKSRTEFEQVNRKQPSV